MKIALASHNFPPEFQGGTERVVAALGRALVASGHEVVVITGSEEPHHGSDVVREALGTLEVLRLPRHPAEPYGLDLRRPRLLTTVEDILIERGIEVLHVHHWSTLSLRLLRSARALGIAAGATLHDMWSTCGRFFRRPPVGITCPSGSGRAECVTCSARDLHAPLEKLALGLRLRDGEVAAEFAAAQWLVAPSHACADAIRTHLPWPGAITVVPHGLLEPARGRSAGRAPGAPLRIGTFGNLVREKGVRVLVEAMAGIAGAEVHLHGPCLEAGFEHELREVARARTVELVFRGPYRVDVRHPALDLDLAVFPSLCQETYGLVVEEALAHGVPVVVSDLGALGERIGGGGVVTPHGDVAALHRVLADLAADGARLAALRAGVPQRFSTIEDAAARYEELYRAARAPRLAPRPLEHRFPPLLPKDPLRGPVLVLAAHPDDEVIACGAMLAWHAARGDAVRVLHVTDGARGDPDGRFGDIQEVRRREGREALRRLGVHDVRSLGFVDGEVARDLERLVAELVQHFADHGPGTLYSFMPTESHRDHRAVALATARAANALPTACRVLLFGVNQVVGAGTMFDVSSFMEQKQHALAAFASQLAYHDFRTKILHRDHAATVNVEDPAITHAEVFADLLPKDLPGFFERADAYTASVMGEVRG